MPNQPAPRPTPNWAADFPKLREATDNWLFGDIWERSGLSKRDQYAKFAAFAIEGE